MANGYATIANGGRFHEPFIIEKVEDKDGEVLYDHSVSDKQAIDPDQGSDIAADVSYALQQVVQAGTGTAALGIDRPAAGKTGTATNDDRPGRLGVVHRLHAAAVDVGHVRPRQGQRAARRLAAVVLRRRLPGRHVDRDHEPRHGGRRRRGLPAAGERRRRGARRRPRADAAAEADQEADADRAAERDRPADEDADRGADADPADPAADDRGADRRPPPTDADGPADPRRRPATSWAARRRRRAPPRRRPSAAATEAATSAAVVRAWWNRMRW